MVLRPGSGYHIIIPIKVNEALEHFEDFSKLSNKPSEQFLRFAKSYLSINKADKANNPSFRSCLLRVSYTFNSKCIEEVDPEVKIIQEFDSSRPLPKIDNLLVEYMSFLTNKKLRAKSKKLKQLKLKKNVLYRNMEGPNSIQYAEILLTIPIKDFRKSAIALILAPYFVNILNLSPEDSFNRITQWVLKCNNVKPFKPSISDLNIIIKYLIKRAKETGIKPLKFEDTIQHKNKKLYDIILSKL